MANSAPNIFWLTLKLVLHMVAGFVGAAVLVGLAILAHYGATFVDQNNLLSQTLTYILGFLEYGLFALDCVCLSALLIFEGWRFIKEVCK